MKRKLLCALLCLLFVLCAFTSEAFAEKLSSEEVDWGISMRADQVSPTGAVILVSQSGGEHTGRLEYGSAYHLEALKENTWKPVPYVRENVAWTMEACGLPENQVTRWEVDWLSIYGYLAPGRYRFVKEFMDYCEGEGNDEADFYAEFVIGMPGPSGSEETPDWGITLYAEDITPTGMTLLTNQMGGTFSGKLEYDTCFHLQVLQDGQWQWVPELIQYACPLVADSVWMNGSWRESLDWERHYGALPPGYYRLVREFYDFSEDDYEDAYLYAEFIITDQHSCHSEDADMLCDRCLTMVKHEHRDGNDDGRCDECGICDIFRMVGNADWMGNWDPASFDGLLVRGEDGIYRTSFIDVPAGTYEFRITKNGVWDGSFTDHGNNYGFMLAEETDISVEFRLENGKGVVRVYGPPPGWGPDGTDQETNPPSADLTLGVPVAWMMVGVAALTMLLRKRGDLILFLHKNL